MSESKSNYETEYIDTALEYSNSQMESRLVSISQLNLLCLYGLAASLSMFIGLVSWAGTLGASQLNQNWPLFVTLCGLGAGTAMFSYGFSQKAFTRMEDSVDFMLPDNTITSEVVTAFQREILGNRQKNIVILEEQIFWKNRLVLRATGVIIVSAIIAGVLAVLITL